MVDILNKIQFHRHTGLDSPTLNPKDALEGFPIFTSTPTHTAPEGTIVLQDDGSLWAMISGTWTKTGGTTNAFSETKTINSAGNITHTTNFEPKGIFVYAQDENNVADGISNSQGFGTGTSDNKCLFTYETSSSGQRGKSTSLIAKVHRADANNFFTAVIGSITSTSYRLDWSKTGTIAINYLTIAF